MDQKTITAFQLFLRIALAFSFLSAVADRFGLWGAPGTDGVVWGNWENFLAYSNAVNSFAGAQTGKILAMLATGLELILAFCLLLGIQLRITAIASGMLLLTFALAMTYSFGIKPSLDYSVWTASGASFLLSSFTNYRYSIDSIILNNK